MRNIYEKQGIADATLFYTDCIYERIMNELDNFLASDDLKYDKIITIPYRRFRSEITNKDLYIFFPITELTIHLVFNKMTHEKFLKTYKYILKHGDNKHFFDKNENDEINKEINKKFFVGGYAMGFGNKNWTKYSRITNPIRLRDDHGIAVYTGYSIDIDNESYDLNNEYEYNLLERDIKGTIVHELNHSYESYYRIFSKQPGSARDKSLSVDITFADENKWNFNKDIFKYWSLRFAYLTYIGETHEMNANIQEVGFYMKEYGVDILKTCNNYLFYQRMRSFKAEEFIKSFSEYIKTKGGTYAKDPELVIERLKKMWVAVYKDNIEKSKNKPVISISTLENMSLIEFLKYWEVIFNKRGDYVIKKMLILKNAIQNEEI